MTDLPPLPAPAKRALAAAHFGSLEDLPRWPRSRLAGLHGIGPAAMRTLDRAVAAAGLAWDGGEVEAYLARLEPGQRRALERVMALIQATMPDATVGIGYGVIGFKLDGRPLIYVGAAKAHCAIYGGIEAALARHADALAGFDTSKGTLRFQPEAPPPDDVVAAIVQARAAAIRH